MGYQAPTWVNNGAPPLNAKNMQDISDNLEYVSNNMVNPNLLDNWYFGNPVNQRGQASYTGNGYGIDRWISGGVSLELLSDNIACTATAGGQVYRQPISPDLRRALAGEKVTFSILCSEISGDWNLTDGGGFAEVHADVAIHSGLKSWTFTVASGEEVGALGWWGTTAGSRIAIRAVKLELGSQQTLAHQENGVWVLNEIPKFGDQLAECQRYYRPLFKHGKDCSIVATAAGEATLEVDYALNPPMRTTPALVGDTHGALRIVAYNMNDLSVGIGQPCDHIALSPLGCSADRLTLNIEPPSGVSFVGKYCFTVDTWGILTEIGLSADL